MKPVNVKKMRDVRIAFLPQHGKESDLRGTISVYCGNTFCRRFRYASPIGRNSDYGNIILRKRDIVEIRCAVCKINILNFC